MKNHKLKKGTDAIHSQLRFSRIYLRPYGIEIIAKELLIECYSVMVCKNYVTNFDRYNQNLKCNLLVNAIINVPMRAFRGYYHVFLPLAEGLTQI